MPHEKDCSTIVIGGGPGGIATAIYLARFNYPVTLIDAGDRIPGRTASAHQLQNLIGVPGTIEGPEFLENGRDQLKEFDVQQVDDVVTNVRPSSHKFTVETSGGAAQTSRFVVVAVGVQDILPSVPGIKDYYGRSLFTCPTCNWYQTQDKPTAIIANDDHGITLALMFASLKDGQDLCVIPDRPDPVFSSPMKARATRAGIAVYESPLLQLVGKPGELSGVMLSDNTELDVTYLYSKLGVRRTDTFLRPDFGVERDDDGYLKVDFHTLETSIPGLYAVGPCNTGPDQVMVAAGQGVTAAMDIHGRILEIKGI